MKEQIKQIKCYFGYHKYYLVLKLTPWSRKIACKNCCKCFGMNDDTQSVIPWDDELEDLYKIMGKL
jgi:hypothetical protein